MLAKIPQDVSILLLPTAVGGSPINKWIENLPHRKVVLYANFKQKAEFGKKYGVIKGVLWHQGEADANAEGILNRKKNMKVLFTAFRKDIGNKRLPILVGKLGAFSKQPVQWESINIESRKYVRKGKYAEIITTKDLHAKADRVHFDSEGEREMGKRFARAYIQTFIK